MKTCIKFLLALLIFFPFSNASAADDDDKSKIGGVRAGWQYSGLYQGGSILEGTDPLNSFYVGVFRENKLIPLLSIGTGIEYSQIGVVDANIDDTSIKLHYISVPIDLRVKLGPVYALGGIALNFRVAEKWKIAGEDFNPSDDNKSQVFDLPLALGVGVKLFIFRIEAKYHWGMLDVYKANDLGEAQKVQYLQLGLGVTF